MFVYIATYFISFLFAYLSEKYQDSENKSGKVLHVFFIILAILIPSIVAGLRRFGIGSDTEGYISLTFKYANENNTFYNIVKYINVEPLYALINIIVSKFTSNINVLYFVLQLIIMIFIFMACYHNRKKRSYSLSYLVFMILFFNKSLNMVRQTMAIAIVLFAYKYAEKRKPIIYFGLIIIATLIHKTAIIGIILYILIPVLKSKNAKLYKSTIILLICISALSFKQIMTALIQYNLLDAKYLYYINFESNIIFLELLFMIFIFILATICNKKYLYEINFNNKIYIMSIEISILLYLFGIYNTYASRLSYYFYYMIIFFIPEIFNALKHKFAIQSYEKANYVYIIGIMLLVAYSCIYYGYYNLDNTVPYQLL